MNTIRKKLKMLLAVCMLTLCISMTAYAADGVLTFSDPTTKVGETVSVKVRLDANGSAIGDGEINVTYDPAKLEFVSGENAEGGDGTVKLFATGNGTETELIYMMEFRALAEGEAKIEVSDYTAYLYNDETLNVTLGSSLVTIEEGDPNAIPPSDQPAVGDGPAVTVNGAEYTISSEFSDVMIPEGFVRTEFTFEGQECQALKQETSGLYMVYLVDAGDNGKMFLYNSENGQFSACEKVRLSDTSDVILMQFAPTESLPETYKETEFEINGVVFPAWQNPTQPEFFVVNAVNTAGQKGYYQYDSSDQTYQRFVLQETASKEPKAEGFFGKLEEKLKANLSKLLIGVWAVFLVLVLVIIILAVKLKHRNEELDDWYEDFGDEYEKKLGKEQPEKKTVKAAKTKKSNKKAVKEESDYEELDSYDEDDFDDADFDFDDEEFDSKDFDDDFDSDDFEDEELYDDFDDEMFADNFDSGDSEDEGFYDDDDDSYIDEWNGDDYEEDYQDKDASKDTTGYSIDFIDLE